MSDDKELPVFATECDEENARLKERIAELEANNARLRGLVLHYAKEADDVHISNTGNRDSYYFVNARELLDEETPADSLAAVRREAIEEARERLINVVENFWNLLGDSGQEDMVRAMRDTKFYD